VPPPPEVVANGSITGGAYISFFGIPLSPASLDKVISYIIFDLPPTLDISSPNFKISVSGWNGTGRGEGTPDPDAIGIVPCHAGR
jgi:hypothetical protein